MKIIPLALIALLSSILLPANFAHATASPYAEAYAVGTNSSTTPQSSFTLNEQPYIYVQFYNGTPPAGSLNNEMTFSTWQTPNGTSLTPIETTSSSNQLWISFSPSVWNNVKQVGTWDTTQLSFSGPGAPASFFEQASFKVNIVAAPEPVGTVLFLVGAFIMGISILRRNKAILA
jgi:hypothetical protein